MNQRIDHLYYESIAYFTAGIMRCLDSCPHLEEETTLYRGLKLDFNSLLIYEKSKGKIILIPPFTSCSQMLKIAEMFAGRESPLKKESLKDKSLFSVIFIIKFNHKTNWISNGYNKKFFWRSCL